MFGVLFLNQWLCFGETSTPEAWLFLSGFCFLAMKAMRHPLHITLAVTYFPILEELCSFQVKATRKYPSLKFLLIRDLIKAGRKVIRMAHNCEWRRTWRQCTDAQHSEQRWEDWKALFSSMCRNSIFQKTIEIWENTL